MDTNLKMQNDTDSWSVVYNATSKSYDELWKIVEKDTNSSLLRSAALDALCSKCRQHNALKNRLKERIKKEKDEQVRITIWQCLAEIEPEIDLRQCLTEIEPEIEDPNIEAEAMPGALVGYADDDIEAEAMPGVIELNLDRSRHAPKDILSVLKYEQVHKREHWWIKQLSKKNCTFGKK